MGVAVGRHIKAAISERNKHRHSRNEKTAYSHNTRNIKSIFNNNNKKQQYSENISARYGTEVAKIVIAIY